MTIGERTTTLLSSEMLQRFDERAPVYDRENRFFTEDFEELRASGYLLAAVPTELGGSGLALDEVMRLQQRLAYHAPATAIAVNMHLYLALTNMYRWKNGAAAAEPLLRRIAAEKLILMTSGGSDGLWPSTTATRENGGYRLNGRKAFCSQAPIANVLSTFATSDDPV